MIKKTYKDFAEAVLELKGDKVSFDTMGLSIGIAPSYLWNLTHMRKSSPPKDEVIEKIAAFFHVEPEYFYEYRLKKCLEFLDDNREFLDHIDKVKVNWRKPDNKKTNSNSGILPQDTQELVS